MIRARPRPRLLATHLAVLRRLGTAGALAVGAFLSSREASAQDFTYAPPGELVPGSGDGRVDFNVYAPGIRFPIQDAPAYANSQVWGVGGSQGPGGSLCDAANYSYPWHDNYCETRTWDMPLCPSGQGHQGQDIRAATCDKGVHAAVAVDDGTITSIGSYSVYLTAADGTRFDYLHMDGVAVSVGQDVKRGDLMGYVSNSFGGTPTSVHLHFNIRQNVDGFGSVYVPPYMSLVEAYQALVGPALPAGTLDSIGCDAGAAGWAWDPDEPGASTDVRFAFDGAAGEAGVIVRSFAAATYREDLCTILGSCEHGFAIPMPYSLFDGDVHEVHAYGALAGGLAADELAQSPLPLSCAPPVVAGVRRSVSASALVGWELDPFWDEAPIEASVVESLALGAELGGEPELLVDGAGALYVVDRGRLRVVPPAAVVGWRLNVGAATNATSSDLARPSGPELRARPLLVEGANGALYLVDEPFTDAQGGTSSGGSGGGEPGAAAGCGCRLGTDAHGLGWLTLGLGVVGLARGRRGRGRSSR